MFFIVLAALIELAILGLIIHYVIMGKANSSGQEFRYVSPVTLHSYSTLALTLAAVCAAGLWALLPITFEQWSYGEAPLAVRVSATGLTVGALFSGAFILALYRMYELGRDPEKEEKDQNVRLSGTQLGILVSLAFVGLTGVAQGALFLVAAVWGWNVPQ